MKVIFHLSQSDPASSSLLQPLQVLCFLDSLRSAARKENPNSLVKIVACSIFFFFWPVHRILVLGSRAGVEPIPPAVGAPGHQGSPCHIRLNSSLSVFMFSHF